MEEKTMETEREFDIAILLPTRGRAEMLEKSIQSLVSLARDCSRVQLMFGFDNDDDVGMGHFSTVVQPWLDQHDVSYTAMQFEPMGYIRLNQYVNALALASDARWLVFWNDDAVMQTQDWDDKIMAWDSEFKLLAFDTHHRHPYSIFPIVPRAWLDLLGYLSPHQISDAWLSQQAYLLDIMQRTDIQVLHDRHDLTGNNKDETFLNRPMLEGNPQHPLDFHNLAQINLRHQDCEKIAKYLETQHGQDMSFFRNVFAGTQDPWEKLKLNDVNKQMVQYTVQYTGDRKPLHVL
jgi:hypothetical protein